MLYQLSYAREASSVAISGLANLGSSGPKEGLSQSSPRVWSLEN